MNPRRLHTLYRRAAGASRHPPLLFVHGGYVSASCWDVYFLPYFSRHGFECHALDLSGHGASEGREHLNSFGLDDYAADVARTAAALGEPPILLAHSMGTSIAERVAEREPVRAAVLMSPVPAMGTLAAAMKLALAEPAFFTEVSRASQGRYTAKTLRLMRDIYYSPDMSPEELVRFQVHFQPESSRAVTELTLLGLRAPRRLPRIPALVLGGECDAVFPPSLLCFSAIRWNAKLVEVPRAGHTIMLDRHWERAASEILHWLGQQSW
ncbi:MAG TPA: alpha/beta fold hydrolase [Burkholderiales bacterium]|nr:alpha/beta fold hydrolase [Betaproteobacteria bacterium]HQR52717.1 alpha/beta fold hydrolase [Burkholderiales bacterium]